MILSKGGSFIAAWLVSVSPGMDISLPSQNPTVPCSSSSIKVTRGLTDVEVVRGPRGVLCAIICPLNLLWVSYRDQESELGGTHDPLGPRTKGDSAAVAQLRDD